MQYISVYAGEILKQYPTVFFHVADGLLVPEPRNGWAEGVSPKSGTLLFCNAIIWMVTLRCIELWRLTGGAACWVKRRIQTCL
jgi:hypothetical protein